MAIIITNTVGEAYNRFFKNRTLLAIGFIGALISLALSLVINSLFAPFVGIQGNPSAIMVLLSSPMFWAELVAAVVVFGLIEIFVSGVFISAVVEGDNARIGSAARNAASRYVSLVGTCIASAAVSLLSMIPATAVFILLVSVGSTASVPVVLIMALIAVVLVIIPIYVSMRLYLSDVFCVAGGKSAIASVRESWSTMKGNLWQILGITLAIGLIEVLIGMPVTLFINKSLGQFVELLLSYPTVVALVMVYMQLTGAPRRKVGGRAKKV
jgi:hypothetical protein